MYFSAVNFKISASSRQCLAVLVLVIFALGLPLVASAEAGAVASWLGVPSFSSLIGSILGYVQDMLISLLAGVATLFGQVLRWGVETDMPVVVASWEVVRNFANMFFIIALIIMAFATIFDIGQFGYGGYDWGSMLTRFVIIALLVNFSLPISGIIIQGAQIVTNIFLNSIGDAGLRIGQWSPAKDITLDPGTGGSGSQRFRARILGCALTVGTAPGTNASPCIAGDSAGADAAAGATVPGIALDQSRNIQIMVNIFLLAYMIFALGIGLVFALVRIPILWFLIVIAPAAWVAGLFPGLKQHSSRWWESFWSWNTFLPIYTFFLYMGIYFLSRGPEIMDRIQETTQVNTDSIIGGLGLTVQEVFLYALSGIFLIGGANMGLTASKGTAAGALAIGIKAKGLAVGRFVAQKPINQYNAARGAAEERLKQFQKEGFQNRYLNMVYSGQEGQERRQAGYAQRFGVRGADQKQDKMFVDKVGREYGNLERQFDLGKINSDDINTGMTKYGASDYRGLAYRKMAAKRGMLTADTVNEITKDLNSNPLALEDFSKTAESSKWNNVGGKNLLRMASGQSGTDTDPVTGATTHYDYSHVKGNRNTVPLRRSAFKQAAADKRSAGEWTAAALAEAIDLEGGTKTSGTRDLLENLGKLRPDIIWELADQAGTYGTRYKDLVVPGANRTSLFKTAILKADIDTLTSLPVQIWGTPPAPGTNQPGIFDPDMQAALKDRFAKTKDNRAKDRLRSEVQLGLAGNKNEAFIISAFNNGYS